MTTDAAAEPTAPDASPSEMTSTSRRTIVDGNALAGVLSGVFADDATRLALRCGHCDRSGLLAEAVVERDDTCAIVRCRACTHTLFTVTAALNGAVAVQMAAVAEVRTPPHGR